MGSGNAEAAFDIGRYRTGIPMVAITSIPDPRGERVTYMGTYIVQEGESLGPTPVFVVLLRTTEQGTFRSVQRISSPLVEILGGDR